ncbi:uncharacterized protein LOC62_04G006288 [Vanrija pseudolonga]|uniref:Mitochondrial ATP synthase epsilon chain-domain-containing protein n=1 Tax=Vanrija pseudolonga TaxID=143232 RepID=A0AAF0YB73_9TREE|nr:hypothetical protein LOC62_04G006288 [Vanrija pseudolonga]
MSAWREFFNWNKYTQIASRAVRTALSESERVAAEKRATIGVKYQVWDKGVAGESTYVVPPKAGEH